VVLIGYQFVSYHWVSIILTILIVTLILHVWHHHSVVGARLFLFTLLLAEFWIIAQGMEMSALGLSTKIVWANIQYIPVMLMPLTYLYLTLHYINHENWLKQRWLPVLLLIIPIAMNILVWTNSELIRQNVYLNLSGAFPTIGKTYGPFFWVFAAYNYLITIITMINLVNGLKEKNYLYRRQLFFLFIAILLPVIANLLHVSGLSPFATDITPVCFGVSALIIFGGIFTYRLFDIVPIARSIIIQEMKTGMIVLDNQGRILDLNPAATKMLRITSPQPIGLEIANELSGIPELISIFNEGKDNVREISCKHDGTQFCYETSLIRITNADNNSIGWLLQIYDITERKVAEEIIKHMAFHDALTGLPNRSYFQVLFTEEMAHSRMRGDMLTVAFLDLDNFKHINDTYGHDFGDRVLCKVADKLKGVLRDSDTIARIGGDEFAILLPHVENDDVINLIGKKILSIFEKDFNIDGKSLEIKASIGFGVAPRDGENIDVLLKKADQAMYSVKRNVKDKYYIYQDEDICS